MALLEINDLIVLYGEIEALRGISLKVEQGQVAAKCKTSTKKYRRI